MDRCNCGYHNCLGHEYVDGKIYFPGFTDLEKLHQCGHRIVVFDDPVFSTIPADTEAVSAHRE